jgi:hypothetical protein
MSIKIILAMTICWPVVGGQPQECKYPIYDRWPPHILESHPVGREMIDREDCLKLARHQMLEFTRDGARTMMVICSPRAKGKPPLPEGYLDVN